MRSVLAGRRRRSLSIGRRWLPIRDREVDRLNKAYVRNLEAAGAELILERATIAGPNIILLASGRRVTAKNILVATGATPFVRGIFRSRAGNHVQ